MVTLLVLLNIILLSVFIAVQCIVPKLCSNNVTLPDAICCPNKINNEPCGGILRGKCVKVILSRSFNESISRQFDYLAIDDRTNWPTSFFSRLCQCNSNFYGIGCEKCRPGWQGNNCSIKFPRKIRKNFLTLTNLEKQQFLTILNVSKTRISPDFFAVNSTNSENCDPINSTKLQLINISIYDYFVYTHFYASRSTLVRLNMAECSIDENRLNFAHKGPTFYPWHRHFLMLFEQELSSIASQLYGSQVGSSFALPYWDWVNQTSCQGICSENGLGTINNPLKTPQLASWQPVCSRIERDFGCHTCDPTLPQQPLLWRARTVNNVTGQPLRLPLQKEIDRLMLIDQYDSSPYNRFSISSSSFRNLGEGFLRYYINKKDELRDVFDEFENGSISVTHNMVHQWLNGSWLDVATSPNDPIFFVHHCFIDKIFELWLNKFGSKSYFSANTSAIHQGHAADDYMVPFLPLVKNAEMFRTADNLGYSYDNNFLGNNLFIIPDDLESSISVLILSIIIISGVLLLATAVIGYTIFLKHRNWSYNTIKPQHSYLDETEPLLLKHEPNILNLYHRFNLF